MRKFIKQLCSSPSVPGSVRRQASTLVLTALAAGAVSNAAHAEDYYVSVSGGVVFQEDSTNDGSFNGDFVTGNGVAVPAGTTLPGGSAVGWDTEFETGYTISGAIGKYYGPFRGEIEVAYQSVDVETHTGVSAAGVDLAAVDAGVLITGSDALGATVGDIVADGQGDLNTLFFFANAIYDFDSSGPIKPYIGAGVGVGIVDVVYEPSAVSIINDESTQFAYQAMVGASYEFAPKTEAFVGYRYRGTTDVSVSASLFDADFDIENRGSIVEAGIRLKF